MGSKRALRATNRSQLDPKYCLAPRRRQASSATRRCSSRIPSTQAPPHRAGSVDRSTLKTYTTPSGTAGTTADVLPSHLKKTSQRTNRSPAAPCSSRRRPPLLPPPPSSPPPPSTRIGAGPSSASAREAARGRDGCAPARRAALRGQRRARPWPVARRVALRRAERAGMRTSSTAAGGLMWGCATAGAVWGRDGRRGEGRRRRGPPTAKSTSRWPRELPSRPNRRASAAPKLSRRSSAGTLAPPCLRSRRRFEVSRAWDEW
uniref:Uncharacterized protein n=1 Tax=Setaria italica TaxID=4555 RepID=K3Y9H5_SETIT